MKKPKAIYLLAGAATLLAAIAAGVPTTRHFIVARFNDPAALPALASDPRVHYEGASAACAKDVSALLPAAMARVESAQGRTFAAPPIVAVFESYDAYARANAMGSAIVAGVSWSGRVTLSPTLCGEERDRLEGVLTHELSHTHLFGWRSTFRRRPPSWFTEGLAVLASNGGGAEGVSDAQATRAIREGYAIVVEADTYWTGFSGIEFIREPPRDPAAADPVTPRQRLAYREAAVFVDFLRTQNPAAFMALLAALLDNENFEPAFTAAYGRPVEDFWKSYRARLAAAD